jgi:hypothetical protein
MAKMATRRRKGKPSMGAQPLPDAWKPEPPALTLLDLTRPLTRETAELAILERFRESA